MTFSDLVPLSKSKSYSFGGGGSEKVQEDMWRGGFVRELQAILLIYSFIHLFSIHNVPVTGLAIVAIKISHMSLILFWGRQTIK